MVLVFLRKVCEETREKEKQREVVFPRKVCEETRGKEKKTELCDRKDVVYGVTPELDLEPVEKLIFDY